MLSRFVIAFLPRSKPLLISWLQSLFVVILEPKKINSVTLSIVSPSICHEVMGPDDMILVFECWVLSQFFHSSLLPSSRSSSVPLHFLWLKWYHMHIWVCYFSWQSWFQLVIHPEGLIYPWIVNDFYQSVSKKKNHCLVNNFHAQHSFVALIFHTQGPVLCGAMIY